VKHEIGMKDATFYKLWAALKKDSKVIESDGEWRRAEATEEPF
jgi:hypothetical protein